MVTLRWKLGPRGSECAWVTKPEQSAPQGRVTTARSPPILLRPHSLEMGRLAKGHRKMPQSQDWIMVSAYVQMFSPLKKKKKNAIAWVEPTQCNVPRVLCWAALGQRIALCVQTPNPPLSPHPHTPSAGSSWGPWPQEDRLGQTSFPRDSHAAPQPLTPNTQRTVLAGGLRLPHLEAVLEASARE